MISVVIPTLNAGPRLAETLAALATGAAEGLVREVIVADGGSGDGTVAIAEAAGCRVVVATAGRGRQLRAGCAAARAPWVLALHADSVPQAGWTAAVRAHVEQAPEAAGWFGLKFDEASVAARLWEVGIGLRSRWLGQPYGDQGLLIARAHYEAVGGYPDWPLMEDVEIVRRIGRRRLRRLAARVTTSADRYRRGGWVRRTLRNRALLARFRAGADPEALARDYG